LIKTSLFLLWVVVIVATIFGVIIFLISTIFPKKKPVVKKVTKFFPMDKIENSVQDSSTPRREIVKIVKSLSEHHPLPPKVNKRPPKAAKSMLDMIFTLSGHTNMDNELREEMFEKLREANPEYIQEFANGKK